MNALDLFESKTMLGALALRKPPQRFLLDNFFTNRIQSDTRTCLVDMMVGSRRLAPFVSPLLPAKVVDREGFETAEIKPPTSKQKMRTTAQDMFKRMAGETIFSPVSPLARMAARIGMDLATMEDSLVRLEEWMCARALADGVVDCVGEGINLRVDYRFDGTHKVTLTGSDRWSQSGSDPIGDMRAWIDVIQEDSGVTVTDVIMEKNGASAFLGNTKVAAYFNQYRQDTGRMAGEPTGTFGVKSLGAPREFGANFWQYDGYFIDPVTNQGARMLDSGRVIVLCREGRYDLHYGAIQDLESQDWAVPRFPKSWLEKDPSMRWISMESAPLPSIYFPQAVLTASVLEGGA